VALGSVVLVQRAAIGFAVATLLRSQLAGVVIGIVLYIGEGILSAVMLAISFGGRGGIAGGFGSLETQWYQYLPFSIGDSVLADAPGPTTDIGGLLLTPVPLGIAVAVTFAYLAVAIALSMAVTERAEITG
jgi:hypothetical protein